MEDVSIIRQTWLSDDEIAIAKTLYLKSDNLEKGREKTSSDIPARNRARL